MRRRCRRTDIASGSIRAPSLLGDFDITEYRGALTLTLALPQVSASPTQRAVSTTRRPLAGGHPPRTRASQQERSRRRYLESPARASPSAEVAIRRMAGPLPASWDSRISLGNSPRPTLQRVEPDIEGTFQRWPMMSPLRAPIGNGTDDHHSGRVTRVVPRASLGKPKRY